LLVPPFEDRAKKSIKLRQSKTENIGSGRDGDKLLAVHGESHRRGVNVLSGVEMPERFPGGGIDGFEGLRIVTEENETACRRHGSAARMASANLRVSPGGLIRFEAVGQQDFLPRLARDVLYAGRVIGLTFGELLRFEEVQVTFFDGQKIEKARLGIVRRRVPVRGTDE